MAYVVLRDGESIDSLLMRFRTEVQRARILSDLRDHRFFQSKGERARIAVRRGIRRAARRQRQSR